MSNLEKAWTELETKLDASEAEVERLKEELDDEKYGWGEIHANVQRALGEGVPPMNWGCKINAIRAKNDELRAKLEAVRDYVESAYLTPGSPLYLHAGVKEQILSRIDTAATEGGEE